ncbi:DUF3800 domain-containing protein [Streptococcus entericus]|uniref:DUF3800 domain-containing protein n=1 Tax=Streptococcus entericus TaxID=155680 RepID=UPI00036F6607|nr:DUF3800 domain-containing protein [Streptococcus entericus]
MLHYFFQDESFHDLKVTLKRGELNFEQLSASPYFINVFLGFSSETYTYVKESYLTWENDNKRFLGISNQIEFKGDSIKAKNFEFGIASMDLRYINFYNYLFNLLMEHDIHLQISTTNKLEFLLSNTFKQIFSRIRDSYGNDFLYKFKYSLIKIIDRHRTGKLIELFFVEDVDSSAIVSEIDAILDKIIREEGDLPHLSHEVKTAKFFKEILGESSFVVTSYNSYNWDYNWSFDGLDNLLSELRLLDKNIVLILDGKSSRTDGMYTVARERFCFSEIHREESEHHVGIRIADFLSNFIGRIIRNLDLDISTASILNLTYIDEKWFDVRKEGFECYKKIGGLLRKYQSVYWTTQVGIYFDTAILFYKFIDYFCSFNNYEAYRSISNKEHTEKLNEIVLYAISSRFN